MKLVVSKDSVPEITGTELVTGSDAWQRMPEKQKAIASMRHLIVVEALRIKAEGRALRDAIELMLLRMESESDVSASLIKVATELGRKKRPPSYSSINRWVNDFEKFGLIGLIPKHKGSERPAYGWEARAMYLYSQPSKPAIGAVEKKLAREGFENVTYSRVHSYLRSLPAQLGDKSKARMGVRLYNNTQKNFVHRTTENLPVGSVYMGDGHTLDVYLKHPKGKKPWRAELTLWLDVTSRYVVGWFLSEAESAHSTLFALSHAVLSHNHIPAMLHIDNGSGYKNKMMSDESTGFYARLGVTVMHSLPYNAKGKGHVERFFGTMERDFNKWYKSYCGADMAEEAIQLLLKKHKKGEVELPTQEQWIAEFTDWLEQYHNTPHGGLNGKTPAQLWATLDAHELETNMQSTALFWPSKVRTVKREAISLDNREYMAHELIQYNNKKLTVEYNLHNDSSIRVLDNKGRWICDAPLVRKADYIPVSRLREAEINRAKKSIERKEIHIQESLDRADLSITHDQINDDIEQMNTNAKAIAYEEKTGTEVPFDINTGVQTDDDIDFLDIDY